MGVDMIQAGVKMRKLMVGYIKVCYRSVCSHPFLVGMLGLLFLLYRSFPFLFSLLVSASPVLVCTAVLLGTLLSFGNPQIPEIEEKEEEEKEKEEEEKEKEEEEEEEEVENVSRKASNLEAIAFEDETVVVSRHENEEFIVERYSGKRKDVTGRDGDLTEDIGASMTEKDEPLLESRTEVDESEAEDNCDKQVSDVSRDLHLESNGDIHEEECGIERLLNGQEDGEPRYSLIRDESHENLEEESSEAVRDSADAIFRSSKESKWKEMDEEDDEDDASTDSGSDRAESSSPDASMADILPMLDELHPLLDSDAPKPATSTHVNSDAESEHSGKSENGVRELDEDNEEPGGEDGDNSNDEEEEDEEEAQGNKEDESKSAIVWTEDDQKNLMDLGTSELERNRRLENLIARRRARKSFKLMAERNLIDFDSDLPFNVPPIATTRCNPFDAPDESYNLLDLPPIPGSAPSIMSKRRNPFDIPYEPNEEKPNLKGDSFQQEFISSQRDAVFRRHESFHVGPSNLGLNRQEKQDLKWRPYFIPEHLAGEGTSYGFERQLSGVSDSKLSSVPDTDSVTSAGDHEEKRAIEEGDSQEMEANLNLDQVSLLVEHGSESSVDVDSQEVEEVEARGATHDETEIILGDGADQHEIQSNSSEEAEQASEHEIEANLSEIKQASQHVVAVSLSEAAAQATSLAVDTKEVQMGAETVEEEYSSRSSSSYFSEVSEKIADLEKEESTSAAGLDEEISCGNQQHFEKHELSSTSGTVEENYHKEPVYDSSPPATEKYLSFSSISSDTQGEKSETISPPETAKSTLPLVDEESKMHVQRMQRDGPDYQDVLVTSSEVQTIKESDSESSEMFSPPETAKSFFPSEDGDSEKHSESMQKAEPGYEKMVAGSSRAHAVEDKESSFEEVVEVSKDDINVSRPVDTEENFEHQNGSLIHESPVEPISTGPTSPSSQMETVDDGNILVGDLKDKSNHVHSSSFDAECTNRFYQSQGDNLDSKALHGAISSEEFNMSESHVQQPASVDEQAAASVPDVVSSKTDLTEDEIAEKEALQCEEQHANSFSSNSLVEVLTASMDKHEKAQVTSRVASDITVHEETVELPEVPVASHQERTSDGGASYMPAEQHPPPVFENVSVTLLDSSMIESKLEEGDLINAEESNENVQNSDAMEDAGPTRNLEIKVSSSDCTNTHASTDRPLKPEKQELSSDTSIDQSASISHIEEQDLYVTVGKHDADDSSSNENLEKIDKNENKDLPSGAISTLEAISESSSSPEFVSPTYAAELSQDAADENEIGRRREVLEYHESQNEISGSHVDRNMEEEVDEIKEIDEGFLTELDTVGDFRVKEADEIMVENPDFGVTCNDQHEGEGDSNLPVLEVRSVEDITLAFRQLVEGAEVEEVIIPSSITSSADTIDKKIVENSSGLQVVEARSLDDIHQVMKRVSDNQEELPHKTEYKHEFTETEGDDVSSSNEEGSIHRGSSLKESASLNKSEEINLDVTALEVRSVEDAIDAAASRQLGAEAKAEEVSPCSSTSYVHGINGFQSPVEIAVQQAVEISIEDVELPMQQNSDENKREDLRNADSIDNPATEEYEGARKVDHAEISKLRNMESDVAESTIHSEIAKDSSDKTSGFSDVTTHESGIKKKKSHRSSSSSSSSSSSTDSD